MRPDAVACWGVMPRIETPPPFLRAGPGSSGGRHLLRDQHDFAATAGRARMCARENQNIASGLGAPAGPDPAVTLDPNSAAHAAAWPEPPAALNISREQRQHQPRVSALLGSVSGRMIRSLLLRRLSAPTALVLACRRDVLSYP